MITREFRKFISSQYLYSGIRITCSGILPAMVLYHYGLLGSAMAIPLGAVCVASTDNPGPAQYRRNGILASIGINFIVALIAGYSHGITWMLMLEIVGFGMFFSLIGVYGNRVSSIGLIALLVFIFNMQSRMSSISVLMNALYFTAGGIWYGLLSFALYTLGPYKMVQQLLGECLMETSVYLRIKAAFYERDFDATALYSQLMRYQVIIEQHQNELREMMFRARTFVTESTSKGRILMMIFLDSIDLFERIMTTQQDYEQLHADFSDSDILQAYQRMIRLLADELSSIGLAIQDGSTYHFNAATDVALQQTIDAFGRLRKERLTTDTIEPFIRLRHILYSLQDLTERIKMLSRYSSYDRALGKRYDRQLEASTFVSPQEMNLRLLLDNLSLKSSHFRHAARVSLAMLAGYITSLLFPLGHGYWILLTVVIIMKPAYSITRQRNYHRIAGTVTGALIGFAMLYFIKDRTALFIITVIGMIIAYSLLKLNYLASSAAITIYVIISFHFISPGGIAPLLLDRVIDTAIGSGIAYLVALFVLPSWEHEHIGSAVTAAVQSNRRYFDTVAGAFTGSSVDNGLFVMARKDAFVALANVSDHFQRMLSEPRSKQTNLQQYHQFVSTTHLLTSHIASLSYYAQRFGEKYASTDFRPLINQIDGQFQQILKVFEDHVYVPVIMPFGGKERIYKKVQQLMEQRKKEMEAGRRDDPESVRRTLSDLKTITEQFQLIYAITIDQARIFAAEFPAAAK